MEVISLLLLILLAAASWRALGGGLCMLACLWSELWVRPAAARRRLRLQGINGPPPSLFYGNSKEMQRIQLKASKECPPICSDEIVAHDFTSTLFPYLGQWRKEYGPIYTYSTGRRQHLYVNEAGLVKEMKQCMTSELGKPSYITKRLAPMLGNGILRSNGLLWAQQRKVVAPPFFMDKVKGMVGLMVESMQPLLEKWEGCIEAQGGLKADITVDEDLRGVTADVISRACFGSSFSQGKHIFSKLRALQEAISRESFLFGLPSYGFMGRKQKEMRELEEEIEALIWDTVKGREEKSREKTSSCEEKDLLQMILEGALMDKSLDKESSKRFIVDNCKNIYFAGHGTTAVAVSWCLLLLALFPEWQARIRAEIGQVFKNCVPDAESVSGLKIVTCVIQEALRLFPPAAFVSREALEDIQIGSIVVPKGVCLWTLIPKLHRDPEIWGPDSNEFKPQRFANGVSKACKFPQAYVPFGLGPRLCLGKNFAMVQLKVVICLIVSTFSFSLSPKYRHFPAYRMIVEPRDGVRIVIQKL